MVALRIGLRCGVVRNGSISSQNGARCQSGIRTSRRNSLSFHSGAEVIVAFLNPRLKGHRVPPTSGEKDDPLFFSCNFVKTRYKASERQRATEVEHRLTTLEKGGRSLQALGKHLLVELHGCNPELLKKVDVVKEILVSAAKACKIGRAS